MLSIFSALLGASALLLAATAVAGEYPWNLPSGFPVPHVPADNPMSEEKVQLGRFLFYDERLSATGTYSCATCHQQPRAFSDGRSRAVGLHGDLHARNSMALVNVAYNPAFQWANPDLRSLEEQVPRPLYNEHPVEMGLAGREGEVVRILGQDARYAEGFRQAFPGEADALRMDNVLRALASFERTLISGRSRFDRYVFDDDRTAFGDAERLGMALFFSGRVGCGGCHFGINFSGPIVHAAQPQTPPLFANTALYNLDGKGSYPPEDTGVEEISRRSRDHGRFRVPTLRNIELSAPYMHDGSLPTLDAVLDHYMAGGRQSPRGPAPRNAHRDGQVRPFDLTPEEQSALLAFLGSLTDEAFLADARFSDPDAASEAKER